MTLPDSTKQFLEGLIDYYISEAGSYKQMAEQYIPQINSTVDAAFGIITGCVYSAFLQSYANQNQKVVLDDIRDFHDLLKEKAVSIKQAIIENKSSVPEEDS